MTQAITRETFVQATRDLPELRIGEVVLQTARRRRAVSLLRPQGRGSPKNYAYSR